MDPMRNESIDAPDFVARYPVDYDTTEGEYVGITPRMAYYLWAGAQILQDDWNDAIGDPHACELHIKRCLPSPGPTPTANGSGGSTNCFTNLTDAIAAGEPADGTYTTFAGEDVALHLVIEYVAAAVADEVLQLPDELDDTYPLYPEHDDDLDYLRDPSSPTLTSSCSTARPTTASKPNPTPSTTTSTSTPTSGSTRFLIRAVDRSRSPRRCGAPAVWLRRAQ